MVRPLVIGNWKMNPATLTQAGKLARQIAEVVKGHEQDVMVVVAPPTPFIAEVWEAGGGRLRLCAQTVSKEAGGAYTGGVSVSMLRSLQVTHVIVGHSEMRAEGLDDREVAASLGAAVAGKLTGVLCVGERERDTYGHYFGFIEHQIVSALEHIPNVDRARVVIAYEPVWAIGTGTHARPEDVHEMRLFIQKVLTDLWGREAAARVPIIYGGSVDADNAAELLSKGGVQGFLVGGASLRHRVFGAIIKTAQHHARFT